MSDIHSTARAYFLAKFANGRILEIDLGGACDGLRNFSETIDSVLYWVTDAGFITPIPALRNP